MPRAIDGLAARARPTNREGPRANDLLPERALIGELAAQDELVERCYLSLIETGTGLLETVDVMFDNQGCWNRLRKRCPSTSIRCATALTASLSSPGLTCAMVAVRSRSSPASASDECGKPRAHPELVGFLQADRNFFRGVVGRQTSLPAPNMEVLIYISPRPGRSTSRNARAVVGRRDGKIPA